MSESIQLQILESRLNKPEEASSQEQQQQTQPQIQRQGSSANESIPCLAYKATEQEWNRFIYDSGLIGNNNNNANNANNNHNNQGNNNDGSSFTKYCTISIMGPQSSGKSTLLNKCFGTRFQTMDHTKQRCQVTTGIWFGSCPKTPNILVMDLEGTDSYERAENRGNFERQTSLMALALSEVLMINMWAADIGRASGMNIDTLRSILQANLRLFNPNSKTLILFVIRDQSPDDKMRGVTPTYLLQKLLSDCVEKIWDEIEKPQDFTERSLYDLFDVEFYFVAPLNYFESEFNAQMDELFEMFTNPSHSKYLFANKEYHFEKCVPPEGLFTWTSQIFDAIANDESLNIPDQQRLLSAYRCEHACNESFELFAKECEWTKVLDDKHMSEQFVPEFGHILYDIICKTVRNYKSIAMKYNEQEMTDKYQQLMGKIAHHVRYLFTSFQLKHIMHNVLDIYEQLMAAELRAQNAVYVGGPPQNNNSAQSPSDNNKNNNNSGHNSNSNSVNFSQIQIFDDYNPNESNVKCVSNLKEIVLRIGQQIRQVFREQMSACMIVPNAASGAHTHQNVTRGGPDEDDDAGNNNEPRLDFAADFAALFDADLHWQEMHSKLREITKRTQNDQLVLLMNENTILVREQLFGKQYRDIIRHCNEHIYSELSRLRIDYYGQHMFTAVLPKLENLMFDESLMRAKCNALKRETDKQMVRKLHEFLQRMPITLRTMFNDSFYKDPGTKQRREWTQICQLNNLQSVLEAIFAVAKGQCVRLLEMSQSFTLESNADLNVSKLKINYFLQRDQEYNDIESEFMEYIEAEYRKVSADTQSKLKSETGITSIIPRHPVTWMVFAWFAKDELWSMLTNPLYLVLVLFLIALLFIGYQVQTMGFDVKTVLLSVGQQLISLVMQRLKQFQASQSETLQRGVLTRDRGDRKTTRTPTKAAQSSSHNPPLASSISPPMEYDRPQRLITNPPPQQNPPAHREDTGDNVPDLM